MDVSAVVDRVIDEHRRQPVDILGIGDTGEHHYLEYHKDGFVRTVSDVHEWCARGSGPSRIVEIGSFLGPVSVSLATLGHSVSAIELPEYAESPRLQEYYQRHGVRLEGANLRQHTLPFADDSLDVVVICEVIEHLNFNPLPLLAELNRVLRRGGLLYIGMPNQANIRNRWRAATGRSIHNPIDDFFHQLDRSKNMVVGLHWREYTLAESTELLEAMGFTIERTSYFYEQWRTRKRPIKRAAKAVLFAYPAFRPYQVVLAIKQTPDTHDFWLTEANS